MASRFTDQNQIRIFQILIMNGNVPNSMTYKYIVKSADLDLSDDIVLMPGDAKPLEVLTDRLYMIA